MRIEISRAARVNADQIISNSAYANVEGAREALVDFCKRSALTYVGTIDNDVVCAYGLIAPTLMSDEAYLWLLTTKCVSEHPFVFVRHSQMVIAEMLEIYSAITGHCNVTNTQAIKWLKWLGAKFGEPEGEMVPFQIRAKNG